MNSEIEEFFDSIETIYSNIKDWLFELIRKMLEFDKNKRVTLIDALKKIPDFSIKQDYYLVIDK